MDYTSQLIHKTFIERAQDWVETARNLALAQKARKQAEEVESYWADMLKQLSNGESSKGGQFKYEKIIRIGTINYKSIPELDGVDLNFYRGKSIESWKLSIEIE